MDFIKRLRYIFLFFNCLAIFKCFSFYRIGSRCGFPGLPHETKIEPQKTVYEDGEEIRYSCPNDKIYVKTQVKKCVSGQWMGPRSTCGNFIRNQLTKVRVIDLSHNQTVVDMNTSNYTNEEYPVAYYDGKGTGLVIQEPNRPHKWFFDFANGLFFDFFLLNVRIPKTKITSKVAINEIDSIKVRDVIVLSEYNRTCALDFTTRQKWAKIFWFWCSESLIKNLDKPLAISFVTYAYQKMESIGLHQVYLTKLQYCGHPSVPLLTQYVPQNEEIQCNPEIAVDVHNTRNSSEEIPKISEYSSHDCVDNPYWAGNPKCIPKSYCRLNYDNSTEEIGSVRNAYIFSDTEWYAIEGTAVVFKCKPGNEFVTDSVRNCQYNSSWDQSGPICHKALYKELPSSSFESSGFFYPTIFIVIVVTLVISILVFVILRKRKTRSDSQTNRQDFNTYDDILHNANEEYAEYNYDKTDEYEANPYEAPNYNRYENPEKTMNSDHYYLKLSDSTSKTDNTSEYMGMTSLKTEYSDT